MNPIRREVLKWLVRAGIVHAAERGPWRIRTEIQSSGLGF